ncbi:uncharacterized protein si:dkey-220k22.3 isoform X2 [Ictalurus punctatus]|uniref:Uncharacterized protein si:dkey-220k22.3 isoform X2 n=1 Tax=Ictalurus punctatus TaxID=7998 RepID=A0A2D0Q897_ICTPU|nr:uncharacterized protein si:dkey-220k22.3 isoform X2 [Ictalurus punctatus]
MAHTARAHVTWMSAVIMVAVTASCVTWLIVSKETIPRVKIINGTSMANMFRVPPSTAQHCLLKVHNSTNGNHLAWEEEGCVENFSLNDDKTSITVKEPGVYLVYVQLTYSLKKDGNSSNIHLNLTVEFTYTEDKVEFNGAFDNRQLTEKEQDAHLTAFFLLKMTAGNKLSIIAYPKNRIKYDDVRPFSSYITIVRYADLSG